jgi:hypothetical protein
MSVLSADNKSLALAVRKEIKDKTGGIPAELEKVSKATGVSGWTFDAEGDLAAFNEKLDNCMPSFSLLSLFSPLANIQHSIQEQTRRDLDRLPQQHGGNDSERMQGRHDQGLFLLFLVIVHFCLVTFHDCTFLLSSYISSYLFILLLQEALVEAVPTKQIRFVPDFENTSGYYQKVIFFSFFFSPC